MITAGIHRKNPLGRAAERLLIHIENKQGTTGQVNALGGVDQCDDNEPRWRQKGPWAIDTGIFAMQKGECSYFEGKSSSIDDERGDEALDSVV